MLPRRIAYLSHVFFSRLLAIGTAAAVVLFLAALAGRLWWVFDALSNYWPQLAAVLFICSGLLWLDGRRWWAAVPLGLSLLAAGSIWPFYWPVARAAPAASEGQPLTLLLSNVYSFRPTLDDVVDLIAAEEPDIVVLLEVIPGHYSQVERLATGYPYHFHEPRITGQAVFSKIPFEAVELIHWPGGRIDVLVRLVIERRPLLLLATHGRAAVTAAKADQRNRHLAAMAAFIDERDAPLLLAGDLNTTPFSSYYKQFMGEAGLRETRLGRGLMGTWPSYRFFDLPPLFQFLETPLDHVLVTPGINLTTYREAPPLNSDHDPLWAEFTLDP